MAGRGLPAGRTQRLADPSAGAVEWMVKVAEEEYLVGLPLIPFNHPPARKIP